MKKITLYIKSLRRARQIINIGASLIGAQETHIYSTGKSKTFVKRINGWRLLKQVK